jgi:hypothetical protein
MGGWIHLQSYPQIAHRQAATSDTAKFSSNMLIFKEIVKKKSYPQRLLQPLNFF